MLIESYLEQVGRAAIEAAFDVDHPAVLRPTQDRKHGDYQMNAAMPLAKKLGKNPRELGTAIAERVAEDAAIASAEVAGPGFVNIRLDETWLAEHVSAAVEDAARDGVPPVGSPETIVVDFSSPNIAKQMHVGHLRSTIIGDAIVRTLRFVGHKVIGDNHLGDWGTQYGLLLVGMREFGTVEALDADSIVELERIYKLASERAGKDEAFAADARAELAKLQAGDEERLELWKQLVAASRTSLERVYERLDIRFDEWLGESAYHEALPGVVELLLQKGFAREDDGAICVFWGELADKYGDAIPKDLAKQKQPFIIRKRDGAFLYSTSDIATVQYRKSHFHADRSVYVVDARQSLHFKQFFALADLLEIDIALQHVGFGVVMRGGKPLKTRDTSGQVITLASLLDEAISRARARMDEEGIDVPEEDLAEVARVVGIGAIKYADLSQNRSSDYEFDWDKMISFKGNAGPYLQYAYARTRAIFRKGEIDAEQIAGPVIIGEPAEGALALRLLRFSDAVHSAVKTHHPHLIADHLYALARAFSSFYEACPVLKAEGEVRVSRLALVALTARQLRRGLGLLGIETVERM